MMKWLNVLAATGSIAICGSCERHAPDVLDRLPGHHASHGEGDHGTGHGEHGTGHDKHGAGGHDEHEEAVAAPHAAAPDATAAEPPPRYFND